MVRNKKNSSINKENKENLIPLRTKINDSFYILGPGDEISITFIGLPEISGNYVILSDGNVQLPLIGPYKFTGLTIEGAKDKLMKLYDSELISPQIYLNLFKAKV